MNLDTIQNALKELYVGLGGDIQDVRELREVNAIIKAIAGRGIGTEISAAAIKELPELPESDGTYALQLVMDDGEAALTWVSAE